MAEMLKRQNDIVTLKVELTTTGGVLCTLQYLQNGELTDRHLWRGGLKDFGLQSDYRTDAPDEVRLHFPAHLIRPLRLLWQRHAGDHDCLWVHLVQPCGNLNFLPWEKLSVDPYTSVLMLPDFIFPPPQESNEQLDVVVCASAPLQSEKADAGNDLIDTLKAIARGVDRPLRLHVFTDTDLSSLLLAVDLNCDVRTYSIDNTATRPSQYGRWSGPSNRSLQSPWLIWMREALRAFSIDAVHFICHGYLSGRHGSLLFAQSPTRRSEDLLSGAVGAAELSNFLVQIGAWSSAFSTPTDNHSMLGLRVLADEIAQALPGPMMMFDHTAASYDVLEDGYRFVHSDFPYRAPRHQGGLFLYCQPYLLARTFQRPDTARLHHEVQELAGRYARNSAQLDTVLSTYALRTHSVDAEIPPRRKSHSAVAAATERAAEQIQLHYQKLIRDEVIPEQTALNDLSIALQTIQQFRQALDEVEQQRRGGQEDPLITDEGYDS